MPITDATKAKPAAEQPIHNKSMETMNIFQSKSNTWLQIITAPATDKDTMVLIGNLMVFVEALTEVEFAKKNELWWTYWRDFYTSC